MTLHETTGVQKRAAKFGADLLHPFQVGFAPGERECANRVPIIAITITISNIGKMVGCL